LRGTLLNRVFFNKWAWSTMAATEESVVRREE